MNAISKMNATVSVPDNDGKQTAHNQPKVQAVLCLRLELQISAQLKHERHPASLARPHRAEHKPKCQRQRQGRIGPFLQ